MYLSYVEYIRLGHEEEIEFLRFEAWKYGPVIENVYHTCKHYRDSEIDCYLNDIDGKSYAFTRNTRYFDAVNEAVP